MPPAEIKESIYPEHMTADELAGALLDLANEFDAYDFMDQVESPETILTEIKYNLLAGLGMQEYASFLSKWFHAADILLCAVFDRAIYPEHLSQQE